MCHARAGAPSLQAKIGLFEKEKEAFIQSAQGVPKPIAGQEKGADDRLDLRRFDEAMLLAECKSRLPAYMVPGRIDLRAGPLPRNPNGKIDRKTLAAEYQNLFDEG